MKSKYLTIILILICSLQGFAQKHVLDSLRHILKVEKEDTNKVNTLNIFSKRIAQNNPDTSLTCANSANELAEKLKYKKGIAEALGNIGFVNNTQGNYPKALEYAFKALTISQEIGNKYDIAENLRIIGIVNLRQQNYSNALTYLLKSLAIFKEVGDKHRIARVLVNIGLVYRSERNYPKAIEFDSASLLLNKQIGDQAGVEVDLDNLGGIYDDKENYKKAQEYYLQALSLARELGNNNNVATNMSGIGATYTELKNYKLAKAYLDSSVNIAKEIGERDAMWHAYGNLAILDSAIGNYKAAYEDYKMNIVYGDSLINDANTKKMMQAQMGYDFARRSDSAKAAQDKLNLITAKESQHEKLLLNSFIGGFVLMLALALLIFIGYRQKQKSNVVITHQKELVEDKNREILDSITYAKRLQEAILPPISLIKKFLPESFVLYIPKDIVAGDFYWLERSGDNILIAAADCTGHGVPGALVSVICSNSLNRTVKEFHITEPGKILDKVTELVLETFEKSESNVQDGMDISLCCINTKTMELKWSGAYNPLWYVQHGEMHEMSADKQPVGKIDNPQPFNTQNIKLKKGDTLYMFSDGYADQFGGPKGKKFKYKRLEELLLKNASKSMEEQKTILEGYLEEWKGNLDQVDDILVMGIKV